MGITKSVQEGHKKRYNCCSSRDKSNNRRYLKKKNQNKRREIFGQDDMHCKHHNNIRKKNRTRKDYNTLTEPTIKVLCGSFVHSKFDVKESHFSLS